MGNGKELKEERIKEAQRILGERRTREIEQELERDRELKLALVENLETAGRYEEAAVVYDELEMYEKAGECRRLSKTSYQISTIFSMGKDGTLSVSCPNCGSPHIVDSKSNLVTCKHCGNNYIIPKKILDMM